VSTVADELRYTHPVAVIVGYFYILIWLAWAFLELACRYFSWLDGTGWRVD
jgi:hypothetical protein